MDRVSRDTTFNEIAVLDGTLAIDAFKSVLMKEKRQLFQLLRSNVLVPIKPQLNTSGEANLAANGKAGAAAASITSDVVELMILILQDY